jgi:polyhydroxyalkanoate synthesis regulator phasin
MIAKGTFTKHRIVIGVVAALAVAGAGGAVAATKLNSPREESQAVLNDAAKELGVQPSELSAALKKAVSNRVDEAVEDGRLSKEEGDAMKARINSGEFPLLGVPHRHFGHGFPHGPKHDLADAAEYLGMTAAQLRTQLNQGKTLAQVARDRDKSVDGLIDKLVAAKKERIDAAVEDGRLTRVQADQILADLKTRVTDLVNSGRFEFRFRDGRRGRDFEERFRSGPGPVLPPEPGLGIAPAMAPIS